MVFLPLSFLLFFLRPTPFLGSTNAFCLAYHTFALFCLPLFILLFAEHPFFLGLGLFIGEFPLFFLNAFSFRALLYLFLLLFCLYGLFRLLIFWGNRFWAQTLLPFFFYGAISLLFLSNEFLYALSPAFRPTALAFLIDSNPFLLLMGSILQQEEFFRSYWMYNFVSDVGSHYPHHFPTPLSIYTILFLFAVWPLKIAFSPVWAQFHLKKLRSSEKRI